MLVAGGSVDYLPKHLCVRFVDAIKARLSLEYPKTEVIVNLDKRLSEIKKSVRLVDETIEVCKALTITGGVNWSGSINAMAEQYKIMIADNMPELSENEKNAFRCVFNGYMPSTSVDQEIRLLSWHISEGYQYDEQVRGFLGSDEAAMNLINRVKSWSHSQCLSVIYTTRAFWK